MEGNNLFLFYRIFQAIYHRLQFDKTHRELRDRYKFRYDINTILSDTVYVRILEPVSRRSIFRAVSHFLEPPSYKLHDVYRVLDIFRKECGLIQVELQCRKLIYCSGTGLGSEKIRTYSRTGERAFIVTRSIKKLQVEDRGWALDKKGFRGLSGDKSADISNPPEDDSDLYYRDMSYTPYKLHQRLIITYSPRCVRYQKIIYDRQIERVRKVISSGSVKKERKKSSDSAGFVGKVTITGEDETARIHYYLDTDKISEETLHGGLYAAVTDPLGGNVTDILKVSEGRWYRSRTLCLLLALFWI